MFGSFFQLFWNEIKTFFLKNWWVFLVLAAALIIIFETNRGNVLEVTTMFVLHFVADVFIMMMVYKYSVSEYRSGTVYQLVATTIFTALTIYTGLAKGSWQYFSSQSLFILAAIKNYRQFISEMNVAWINTKIMLIISFVILFGFYIPNGLLHGISQWVQTTGMLLFAIALSITNQQRTRYILSLLGLIGMVVGSGSEMIRTFILGDVVGLDISFFLLPATVLIVYLKLWNQFITARLAPE